MQNNTTTITPAGIAMGVQSSAGSRPRQRGTAELPDIWKSRTPAVHSRRLAVEPLLSRSSLFFCGSSFCIQSPCPQECTTGVRKLGRGTAAGRPRPWAPADVHRAWELSFGRRGAPRRLFFLYSSAVPAPRKC